MAVLRGLSAGGTDHPPSPGERQVVSEHEEQAKLEQLHADGLLTDAEHEQAKAQLEQRPDPARRRRQLPLWAMIAWPVALAAAGIGLIVWALTSGGSGSSGTPVNGLIAVVDHQSVAPDEAVSLDTQFGTGGYAVGKPCHTLTGYPDIVTGSPVVITDGSGKTLARTKLRPGVFDVNADCVFGFVTSVKKSDTYQIKVGQRDPVNYPAAAITHPQLSLGG